MIASPTGFEPSSLHRIPEASAASESGRRLVDNMKYSE